MNISYDGTNYSGWQRQPNAVTVQEKIEEALFTLVREKIAVMGCGRTDAGVHAKDFCIHFETDNLPQSTFLFRLNQILPPDIAAHSCKEVAPNFHSRFDAVSRTYEYHVHLNKDPFLYGKSLFLFAEPNLKLLKDCCTVLLAEEDFAAFCKSGAENKTTICHMTEANWTRDDHKFVFRVTANRFLRNMVRAIVGTCLEVGLGKLSLDEFTEIVKSKDRKQSSKSAAACGLYLVEVKY